MTTGFNLAALRQQLTGTPGGFRVVYEGRINAFLPNTEVNADIEADLGAGEFTPGMTLGDCLSQNGFLDDLENIERRLADKGQAVPQGYNIRVIDAEGNTVHDSMDLDNGLDLPIEDGQVVVISGKLQGA